MGTGTGWLDQRLVSSGVEREDCKLEPSSDPSQLSGQGDLERSKEQRGKKQSLSLPRAPPAGGSYLGAAPCKTELGSQPRVSQPRVTRGFGVQGNSSRGRTIFNLNPLFWLFCCWGLSGVQHSRSQSTSTASQPPSQAES